MMMMTHVVVGSADLGSKVSNTKGSTLLPRGGARSTDGLSCPARRRNHSPSHRWLQRKVDQQQNLELIERPGQGGGHTYSATYLPR